MHLFSKRWKNCLCAAKLPSNTKGILTTDLSDKSTYCLFKAQVAPLNCFLSGTGTHAVSPADALTDKSPRRFTMKEGMLSLPLRMNGDFSCYTMERKTFALSLCDRVTQCPFALRFRHPFTMFIGKSFQ